MNKKYVGWIPTISGNLFFSNFLCCNDISNEPISKNYIDDKSTRYVVLSAKINSRDSKKYKAKDGIFRVIMQCSGASNASSLSGKIHIYKQELELIKNDEIFNALTHTIYSIDKCDDEPDCVRTTYGYIEESTQKLQQRNDFYTINFSVNNYGFIELSSKNTTDKTILVQAFYFIKYSLHKHYHHEVHDDSITTIYDTDNNDIATCLINELKKSLVDIRRGFSENGHHSLFRSKGIIAYGKSLIESCYATKKIETKQYLEQMSYMNNIAESLDNIAENLKWELEKKIDASNRFRSWVLLFLAVFTPIGYFYKDEISINPDNFSWIINFISTLYSNQSVYISVIISWVVLYWLLRLNSKYNGILLFLKKILTIIAQEPKKSIWKISALLLLVSLSIIFISYNMINSL